MYLSPDEYIGEIPKDELVQRLSDAQRAVDGLTFNRIVKQGLIILRNFSKVLLKMLLRNKRILPITMQNYLKVR